MPSVITSDGGFISILDLTGTHFWERDVRYTTSLLLHLVYGHRVSSTDDKYVRMSETAVAGTIEGGIPGSQVVDFFPVRKLSLSFVLFFLALFCNLKVLSSQWNIYRHGYLAWPSNDTLLRFAKMSRQWETRSSTWQKTIWSACLNLTFMRRHFHPPIEIRFYDLLGGTPPWRSYSRRAGIGWRYPGYQVSCDFPLFRRVCFMAMAA